MDGMNMFQVLMMKMEENRNKLDETDEKIKNLEKKIKEEFETYNDMKNKENRGK